MDLAGSSKTPNTTCETYTHLHITQESIEIKEKPCTVTIVDHPSAHLCYTCFSDLGLNLICSNMEHTLCNTCYKHFISSPPVVCSICNQSLIKSDIKKALEQNIRQNANKTMVHCTTCDWHGMYGDIHTHLKDCPQYKPSDCPHKSYGCTFHGKLEEHDPANCRYKPVPCPYRGCSEIIALTLLSEHQKICDKRPVKKGLLSTQHHVLHKLETMSTWCKRTTTKKIKVGDLPSNEMISQLTQCVEIIPAVTDAILHPKEKNMSCPLKCGLTFTHYNEVAMHCNTCSMKPVQCNYAKDGCPVYVLPKYLEEHTKQCPYGIKEEPCTNRRARERRSTSCETIPYDVEEHRLDQDEATDKPCSSACSSTDPIFPSRLILRKDSLFSKPVHLAIQAGGAFGPVYSDLNCFTDNVYIRIKTETIKTLCMDHNAPPLNFSCYFNRKIHHLKISPLPRKKHSMPPTPILECTLKETELLTTREHLNTIISNFSMLDESGQLIYNMIEPSSYRGRSVYAIHVNNHIKDKAITYMEQARNMLDNYKQEYLFINVLAATT